MVRRFLAVVAAVTLATFAAAQEADYAKTVAKIELADGDTLVFLGDSITHQCLYTQYIEDYFYTRYPKTRIRFHNSGVGGDRNIDALNRFEADVAKYKPKFVTVLLGMNDGRYQPFDQQTFDTYESDMITLIDRIKGIGATPVLMTPTMYDARAARLKKRNDETRNTYYNATLAYFGARIQEMAFVQGLGFVDMYSPLNSITMQQRKSDPTFTLIEDAVHPGANGQVVMAAAILNDMHPNRQVSSLNLSVSPKGYPKANAANGEVISVENDAQTIRCVFKANCLPWVLPEEAALGYKLTKAGHKLSREQFRASGLAPGRYELAIDGTAVGTFSADQLARGVELQGNAKTPQYQQALAVAMLNKKRNDEAYRPLRNLWRDKKVQLRLAAQAKQNPGDEKIAKQLAAVEKKLESFDTNLQELQDKAKAFEDKIYEVNQPKEHTYELKRVEASKQPKADKKEAAAQTK